MIIYLLRHGQTSWNRDQRLQGLRDVPLNRVGIQQSRRLAEWHRTTSVRRIVSSRLLRARDTDHILAECRRASVVDERLREIDRGPWTGLRLAAIETRFPDEFATWSLFSGKLRLSNSESLAAVYTRCTEALVDLIKDTPDEDVLVVSRGLINALLLCAAMRASLSRIREYSPHNSAVSALSVQRRKIVAVERKFHVAAD